MYYYIVNPSAGRGAINQLQDKLRGRLTELGISGEFVKTTGPGDAAKLAEQAAAKGHKTIVAVGGDETVNEILNGIAKADVAVGIIPIGRSNELATQLDIPDWQAACQILAARRIVSFALIAAGQRYWLSTLSIGFETDTYKRVDATDTDIRSRLRHFSQTWGLAAGFQPLDCHITVDSKLQMDCQLFSLTVANQKFNNPLDDNKLVVNISSKPARPQLGAYLWQLLKGTEPLTQTATTRFTANRIVVDTKPPTGLMIDGKLSGRTPIAIRLTEHQLKFIVGRSQA